MTLNSFKSSRYFLFVLSLFLLNCKENQESSTKFINAYQKTIIPQQNQNSSNLKLENWFVKDMVEDTLPGTSLQKLVDTINVRKIKNKDTVIIAVLDSPLDIYHNDLKDFIWVNRDEVPDNNKDDDNNGFIDDINGWNFQGLKDGSQNIFVNYEYTRILRKYKDRFENQNIKIGSEDSIAFTTYLQAKAAYKEQVKFAAEDTVYGNMLSRVSLEAKKTLAKYFKNEEYTISSLDSLKSLYPKDTTLQNNILTRSNFIKYGFTDRYISNYKLKSQERFNKMLNLAYDDRKAIADQSENIVDSKYGNNVLNNNVDLLDHSTRVAGIIANFKKYCPGLDFSKVIKIMPVVISGYGDEHDKDIALAIRYAVDNGAKIINMSFSKKFSMHKEWVDTSFEYAAKHNVLIVSSAGNDSKNLDSTENHFPTDKKDEISKISNNFLLVGASSSTLNEKLIPSFSNYGKKKVDIFAPGYKVASLLPNNKIKIDSGTSLSSGLVSGIAAIIYAYFPEISVEDLKKTLLITATKYHQNVMVKSKEGEKSIPFKDLSKSGGVVNALDAFLTVKEMFQESDSSNLRRK